MPTRVLLVQYSVVWTSAANNIGENIGSMYVTESYSCSIHEWDDVLVSSFLPSLLPRQLRYSLYLLVGVIQALGRRSLLFKNDSGLYKQWCIFSIFRFSTSRGEFELSVWRRFRHIVEDFSRLSISYFFLLVILFNVWRFANLTSPARPTGTLGRVFSLFEKHGDLLFFFLSK